MSRPENWERIAQQLGYTGPIFEVVGLDSEGGALTDYGPQFRDFIAQKQAEGYEFVVDASTASKQKPTVGLRGPNGQIISEQRWDAGGFGDFFKEFVLPSVGAYFGGQALGNALIPLENALTGAGAAGGAAAFPAGYGIAEGIPAMGASSAPAAATAAPAVGAAAPALTGTGTPAGALASGAQAAGAVAGAAAPAAGPTGIELVDKALNLINTPAGQAVLGAAGSVVGGIMEAGAAQEAAQTQAQAAQNALALQREMFEYQKGLLEPYRTAGTKALERLSGAMGLGGPGSQQQMLEMDPGYGFRLGEGLKALERMQASRGNFLSGGALKAGQRFAQDTASQEYGNAYNRLANIAGLGQTVGGQLGNAAAGFGTSAGNIMGQEANALAAGRAARGSAYSNAIGGALGSYQNYLNRQQEERLIRDIFGRTTVGG
jgi:hypothetical protein